MMSLISKFSSISIGSLLAMIVAVAPAQETLKVGDKAPDFEVTSQDKTSLKLSDRLGERPVILLFSRANW